MAGFIGGYGNATTKLASGTYYNLDVDITPEVDGSTDGYFFAHQFAFENHAQGGYLGLQTVGAAGSGSASGVKCAIFSIWEADQAQAAGSGWSGTFGGEGVGYSCRIPFNWVTGRTYRLRIWYEGSSANPNWWGAWVRDMTTGVETKIGSIHTPTNRGNLKNTSIMFHERYSGDNTNIANVKPSQVRFDRFRANANSVKLGTVAKYDYTDKDPTATGKFGTQVTRDGFRSWIGLTAPTLADKTLYTDALRLAADSIAANSTFDPVEAAFNLAADRIQPLPSASFSEGGAPTTAPPNTTTPPPVVEPTPDPGTTPTADFTLQVDEQFSTATLDSQRWVVSADESVGLGSHTGGHRDAELVRIASGVLEVSGKRNLADDPDWNHWFVGQIQMQKKSQKYGKWEIRSKFTGGKGWVPVFGLWPTPASVGASDGWPAAMEVRVMEGLTSDRSSFRIAVRKDGSAITTKTVTADITAYHTYGVEWTSTALKFYFDGTLVHTITDTAFIPTTNHHFFALVEAGNSSAEAPSSSDPIEGKLSFDWIKQWSWSGGSTPTEPNSGTQPTNPSTPTPTEPTNPGDTTPSTPTGPVTATNPLSGKAMFVDLDNFAYRDGISLGNTPDGRKMARLGRIAQGTWIGKWTNGQEGGLTAKCQQAKNQGQVFQCVLYNIVGLDVEGGYSSGSAAKTEAEYLEFVTRMAKAMAVPGLTVLVVLEPDALPQLLGLSREDQPKRLGLLRKAAQILKGYGFFVYQDIGHNNWWSAQVMVERFVAANVDVVDGFALNMSNNCPWLNVKGSTGLTLQEYALDVSKRTGGKHCVVDTSRAGGTRILDWCNPRGSEVKFGPEPTTNTGFSYVDAFVWGKRPGESDGTCNGGPSAGEWWRAYALEMANNTWPSMT